MIVVYTYELQKTVNAGDAATCENGVSGVNLTDYIPPIETSTRRFWARPSSVSLPAIGF